MIKIVKAAAAERGEILTRDIQLESGVEESVHAIIEGVREDKDQALIAYTEKFDKVRLSSLRVGADEIEAAYHAQDEAYKETLAAAAENIRAFHKQQVREGFRLEKEDGVILGQKITPIEKAGLYVPGGTAAYPSSVLMNAIPAKIAGVKELVMTTPPAKDGKVSSFILAAAYVAGVDTVIPVGGAQAIAALAYGTQSVPKVDKIVGPGNVFVATAKRMLYGVVDIDMIAGPSEILVIADETGEPERIAADLLSQAEHDKLASAILVTTSRTLANAVSEELEKQIPVLWRHEIARTSIDTNGRILLVDTIEEAVNIANEIAPEHLEVYLDDPFVYLDQIKNAGSIFLGKYTPEAVGDYFAGPNHTLPTSGTARFSSPLSVDDFIKKTQYISYTKEALQKAKDYVAGFALKEGLEGHAQSVLKRFEK
ncbi:MAG: histidinol dehydrogenase [Clostridiales bacterium]|nr:histidinol dehydrogenase [Clostridiales bacterium]